MPDNKYYSTTRYEIEAAAFRRMAAFIHEHYEDIRANDTTTGDCIKPFSE